jgi:hypothetical protein
MEHGMNVEPLPLLVLRWAWDIGSAQSSCDLDNLFVQDIEDSQSFHLLGTENAK